MDDKKNFQEWLQKFISSTLNTNKQERDELVESDESGTSSEEDHETKRMPTRLSEKRNETERMSTRLSDKRKRGETLPNFGMRNNLKFQKKNEWEQDDEGDQSDDSDCGHDIGDSSEDSEWDGEE